MHTWIIAATTAVAGLAAGALIGIATTGAVVKAIADAVARATLKQHNGPTADDEREAVYDWDATITTGDGVVRVPIYRDGHGADQDAVLELGLDDAHQLGALLESAARDGAETAQAAVDA